MTRLTHTLLACAVGLVATACGSSSERKSVASTPTTAAKARATPTPRHRAGSAKAKADTTKPKAVPVPARVPKATAHASPTPRPTPVPPATKPKVAFPKTIPLPVARAKLGAPRKWSGTGDDTLGTVTLARDAVVHWTVSGGEFSLTDAGGRFAISGRGATGQSFAAAGTYASVKVTASGKWTLTIASLGA